MDSNIQRELKKKNTTHFFCCAENERGIYDDHRVQISTSEFRTKVFHPHLHVATDFFCGPSQGKQ